jgi:outer membrane protein assembly factor BamE (lipoprotein component of BamABCDE complex)
MCRVLAAALAATCLVCAATAGATIKPGRGMSRVELGMTPAQVQAKLGRPVAKGGFKWFYARVTVTFRNRRVVELMTTRSTERFANGLGVDSSEAQVRAAWPQVKCAAMPPFYRRCRIGTGTPGSRNTDFIFGTTHRVIYVIVTKLP